MKPAYPSRSSLELAVAGGLIFDSETREAAEKLLAIVSLTDSKAPLRDQFLTQLDKVVSSLATELPTFESQVLSPKMEACDRYFSTSGLNVPPGLAGKCLLVYSLLAIREMVVETSSDVLDLRCNGDFWTGVTAILTLAAGRLK